MNERRQTIDLGRGGELRISAPREKLVLSSWDRDKVEIRARLLKPESMSEERARRALESARIDVSSRGRFLRVSCGSPGAVPLLFEILVPQSCGDLDVDAEGCHLEGRDLRASVRARVGDGSCRLVGLQGSFDVESGRGDVLVEAVELRGSSRIETGSGGADIRVPGAQGLRIKTNHSRPWRSLDFEAVVGDGSAEIFARTRNGRVRLFRDGKLAGTLRRGGEVQWQPFGRREFDWLRELVSIVQSIRF